LKKENSINRSAMEICCWLTAIDGKIRLIDLFKALENRIFFCIVKIWAGELRQKISDISPQRHRKTGSQSTKTGNRKVFEKGPLFERVHKPTSAVPTLIDVAQFKIAMFNVQILFGPAVAKIEYIFVDFGE